MFKWAILFLVTLVAMPLLGQDEAPPLRGAIDIRVEIDPRGLTQIDTDVVIVPVFSEENPLSTILKGASSRLAGAVDAAATQEVISGELYEILSLFDPEGMATPRLLLIGAGEESELDAERIRRLAGTAARKIKGQKVNSMTFFLRGSVSSADAATAAAEGAVMGLFDAGLHKSATKPPARQSLHIAGTSGEPSDLQAAAEKGVLMAGGTNLARSLAVEPANYATPEILASHARSISREGGLAIEVFDDRQLEQMGMGAIMAVGKGSVNLPRLIVMRYRPSQPSDITLAFVGKGVCFDSGGISLKGGSGMYRMKGDMAGGASVLGIMKILAGLEPRVNVLGIVPAVENMPGPYAQKPGDVFVGYSGKTVEVMSTDAEGRLILSDGVSYAVEQGATHIVDIATLTGTVGRALGDRHVGAFASDDDFFEELVVASRRSGESFWRLPIDEEYARDIKDSLVADLNETGGNAGASVGAKFIQQFTDGKPWIHLDIAGLSWPSYTPPYRSKGPTGVTVRTLAELAMLMGGGSESPTP